MGFSYKLSQFYGPPKGFCGVTPDFCSKGKRTHLLNADFAGQPTANHPEKRILLQEVFLSAYPQARQIEMLPVPS